MVIQCVLPLRERTSALSNLAAVPVGHCCRKGVQENENRTRVLAYGPSRSAMNLSRPASP